MDAFVSALGGGAGGAAGQRATLPCTYLWYGDNITPVPGPLLSWPPTNASFHMETQQSFGKCIYFRMMGFATRIQAHKRAVKEPNESS
jgi:hypothetical protein